MNKDTVFDASVLEYDRYPPRSMNCDIFEAYRYIQMYYLNTHRADPWRRWDLGPCHTHD